VPFRCFVGDFGSVCVGWVGLLLVSVGEVSTVSAEGRAGRGSGAEDHDKPSGRRAVEGFDHDQQRGKRHAEREKNQQTDQRDLLPEGFGLAEAAFHTCWQVQPGAARPAAGAVGNWRGTRCARRQLGTTSRCLATLAERRRRRRSHRPGWRPRPPSCIPDGVPLLPGDGDSCRRWLAHGVVAGACRLRGLVGRGEADRERSGIRSRAMARPVSVTWHRFLQ
jgi:hypothetical protein